MGENNIILKPILKKPPLPSSCTTPSVQPIHKPVILVAHGASPSEFPYYIIAKAGCI